MTEAAAIKLKPGQRLSSSVCDTQVVVVRAPVEAVELRCGGFPMSGSASGKAAEANRQPDPAFAAGTVIGKRYADAAASLEVLCVRGGDGTLTIGAIPLQQKAARTLPASD